MDEISLHISALIVFPSRVCLLANAHGSLMDPQAGDQSKAKCGAVRRGANLRKDGPDPAGLDLRQGSQTLKPACRGSTSSFLIQLGRASSSSSSLTVATAAPFINEFTIVLVGCSASRWEGKQVIVRRK